MSCSSQSSGSLHSENFIQDERERDHPTLSGEMPRVGLRSSKSSIGYWGSEKEGLGKCMGSEVLLGEGYNLRSIVPPGDLKGGGNQMEVRNLVKQSIKEWEWERPNWGWVGGGKVWGGGWGRARWGRREEEGRRRKRRKRKRKRGEGKGRGKEKRERKKSSIIY